MLEGNFSLKDASQRRASPLIKNEGEGLPGGSVVRKEKIPPANAGDMGSIPGQGGAHMLRSN